MLIVSKFKDFYDACVAYGVDKKIVFKRKNKEDCLVINKRMERYHHEYFEYAGIVVYKGVYFQLSFLYFCGEFYPYLMGDNKVFGFTKEDVEENLKEFKKKSKSDFSESFAGFPYEIDRVKKYGKYLSEFKKYLNENLKEAAEAYCKENKVAYFDVLKNHYESAYSRLDNNFLKIKIEVHPNLKDMNFGKFMSPYEIFTKIEQYVGYLNDETEKMVEISDKDKAVAHGHDGKYSFKTPPQSKK